MRLLPFLVVAAMVITVLVFAVLIVLLVLIAAVFVAAILSVFLVLIVLHLDSPCLKSEGKPLRFYSYLKLQTRSFKRQV